ncbi:SH3 beta-barrel fold-containing protein [Butyricimonas paravirosa]
MKAIAINTNNIIENAIKWAGYSMDTPTAIWKCFMLETLKARILRGEVVRFAYMKLDGSVRFAVGIQSDAVKANTTGTGMPKKLFDMFAYIDLQKMAWRGFKPEKLIGIID